MRVPTIGELDGWDSLVASNPDGGNALQTGTWGDFKARWGWQPRPYIYELGGRRIAVQWLARNIPLLGEIWYCPKGPGITSVTDMAEIVRQTKGANLPAVFLRFESEILDDEADKSKLAKLGLVRANRDPGSKSTIFIDLSPSEDEIIASFKQKGRYNVHLAERGGVTVRAVDATAEHLQTMFELMQATEARAKYGLRPEAYFKDYWSALVKAGQGQIFFAEHEGEVLAGLFATFLGRRGWYKDGGSFDKKRELNASYLMQWEVMRWLKAHGVESYDMVGVPNRDQVGTGDSRDGLYSFKSKFNPEITEFIGCYDLPLNPRKYQLWLKLGERIAAKLASRKPERFLY